jgi:hypothetical protein
MKNQFNAMGEDAKSISSSKIDKLNRIQLFVYIVIVNAKNQLWAGLNDQ